MDISTVALWELALALLVSVVPYRAIRGAIKRRQQLPVAGKHLVEIEETPADEHLNSGSVAVTVKTLETTLRSDLAALGIDSFECPFDPQKIVCLRRKIAKDEDFVRLRFFHPEGMAQIVGVGLPFSEVVLWEQRNLEVREMSPVQWRESWMANCSESYTLILFSGEITAEEPFKSWCVVPELQSRTPGVCETVSPRQWIGSLVKLLRLSVRYPSRGKQKGIAMRRGGTEKGVDRKESDMRSGSSAESGEVGSSSTSLPEPELSITVFFRSSRKELRVPVASDHVVQKPTSSSWSCWRLPITDEVDNTRAETRSYQLEARAVIEFSPLEKPAGTSVKSFISTLQVDFNMPRVPETSTENWENFGWYQDDLGVSFRCTQDGAARKETKGIDQEVLSKHWVCENQRKCDREETVSTVTGRRGNAVVGVSTPAKAGISVGIRKEKTTTKGNKTHASRDTKYSMLEQGNLRIRYCGETSRLAYCFTHSPSPESYNVWDVPEDREELSCDVMTSNMPIEVTGIWKIVDGAEAVSYDGCQYELLCERHLTMHQQVIVPSKTALGVVVSMYIKALSGPLYVVTISRSLHGSSIA
ncbi:hypothetical protein R1sor_001683 [Riccia sorocarpa]|uniref:Uncharacterized protein n=1 Tax=Riccia sorocarpa TaxID=122646 RepID=A0ABD3GY99_9MARC